MDTILSQESLEFTGERMVPEKSDANTFWEHIYRYRFASSYVRGKRVLDIACGEGYGAAALLKAGASSVIGIDVSEETCSHARSKYGVDARVGDAQAIPLPDRSIDVIVSFETIEHVPDPDAFLKECVRVLSSKGLIIISTPDKDNYNYGGEGSNPYHCSEMTENQFRDILRRQFKHTKLFGQKLTYAPWWSIHSIAIETSWWNRTRGLRRIVKIVTPLLSPHTQQAPATESRLSVVQEILKHDAPLSSIVNRYTVRPKHEREIANYLIAVAR